jgi:primase-polymerase (primpol)-like protein
MNTVAADNPTFKSAPPRPPRTIESASQVARIPLALTELDRWGVWRYESKDAGWTKVPYQVASPQYKASSTNLQNWTNFSDALRCYLDTPDLDGVGFVFHPPDGFMGIDLDNSLDEAAHLKPWASEIFARLNCADGYAEVSPSLRGIKVWMRGAMPAHNGKPHIGREKEWCDPVWGKAKIELYSWGRFFTTTGRVFVDGGAR